MRKLAHRTLSLALKGVNTFLVVMLLGQLLLPVATAAGAGINRIDARRLTPQTHRQIKLAPEATEKRLVSVQTEAKVGQGEELLSPQQQAQTVEFDFDSSAEGWTGLSETANCPLTQLDAGNGHWPGQNCAPEGTIFDGVYYYASGGKGFNVQGNWGGNALGPPNVWQYIEHDNQHQNLIGVDDGQYLTYTIERTGPNSSRGYSSNWVIIVDMGATLLGTKEVSMKSGTTGGSFGTRFPSMRITNSTDVYSATLLSGNADEAGWTNLGNTLWWNGGTVDWYSPKTISNYNFRYVMFRTWGTDQYSNGAQGFVDAVRVSATGGTQSNEYKSTISYQVPYDIANLEFYVGELTCSGTCSYETSVSVNGSQVYSQSNTAINQTKTVDLSSHAPPYELTISATGQGGNIFLDNVRFLNSAGLSLNILDPTGTPITDTLTLNTDGWPTPNPLTVQMSITNTTGMTLTNPALVLSIDSPYAVGEYEGRFYVMETNGFDAGLYGISGVQYKVITDTTSLAISQTTVLTAQVWIQPSITTTLEFAAELYTDSGAIGQDDPLGQATKLVNVPQAKIHPLVFIPGFLGTWPPKPSGKPDPITNIYDNLFAGLERAGYESGSVGSGATLVSFGWDWRERLSNTGQTILKEDVEEILNTPSANKQAYVDYSKVDIIAHSAGGLVSRAYIEHRYASNEQNVNKFITVATPHKGVPGAYKGLYGGDPSPLGFDNAQFEFVIRGLALCDADFQNVTAPPGTPAQIAEYMKNNMPSVPQLLPAADVPPYLIDFTGTIPYPFGRPDNPFIDDLNDDLSNISGTRDFDVTKLDQIMQTITSFSPLRIDTPGQYQVVTTTTSTLWQYGEITATQPITGDFLVPTYSGNLREITALSSSGKVVERDESSPPPGTQNPLWHVSLVYEPVMVRRLISYVTGIDVTGYEPFWDVEYSFPSELEQGLALFVCAPQYLPSTWPSYLPFISIVDPQGRQTSLAGNGQVLNDIPGASFVANSEGFPQVIRLPEIEGQYKVEGVENDQGVKIITLQVTTGTHSTFLGAFVGQTSAGQAYEFYLDPSTPQENGGQIVLEAEQFTGQIGRSNQLWQIQSDLIGYTGTGYISIQPDTDLIFTNNYTTTSPELQYTINLTTAGTYIAWLRGYAPNAAGDSVYIGLDNEPVATLTGFAPQKWSWADQSGSTSPGGKVTFDIITPGIHTLHLWMREDGLRLDSILLTTDANYDPNSAN